jgi:hypothetical protein
MKLKQKWRLLADIFYHKASERESVGMIRLAARYKLAAEYCKKRSGG